METKKSIGELVQETSREYQVHILATPTFFCRTLMGWEIDIIPFGDRTQTVINAVGRHKTETKAYQAGIEYVRKHYTRVDADTVCTNNIKRHDLDKD